MARRKHDEGSIFQRKDGRYVAQVRLENGKKKQRYFQTEKEANQALRKMLNEKEQGTLPTGPNQTLKVYLEQWIEQVYKLSVIRTGTYYTYRSIINKHIIPTLGHVPLQKLTPQRIQAFYTKKLDEGLSAKTVSHFHTVLHKALEQAVKWNLMARNVCDLVTPPTSKRHEMKPLTPEQAQRLLEVAGEHKLEALLTLAVTTGMRRGELLALHWQDIDFSEGCLYVRRTISRIGKFGLVVSEPKTEKSKRKIALPLIVLVVLKQQQEHRLAMREKAGAEWKESDIVFCNRHGGYIEPANLFTDFKRLLKLAELPNIRFHDLRHSAASFLAKLNVHPKIVQELLGHSNISTTLDIYSHMFPSTHQEAMGKLDDLFKKDS
jgi:integrase